MSDVSDLYLDEELGSDYEQAFTAVAESRTKRIHTALPGIIKSYDPTANTVSVQPAIQIVMATGGTRNFPVIPNVPVLIYGSGNFIVTPVITAGDECLVIFFERAIDFWFKNGGVQQPSSSRLHNPVDAVCIPGLRSQPNKVPSIQTDGLEIRTLDRSKYIKLKSTGIEIVGNITVTGSITVSGEVTASGKALSTHKHTGVTAGGAQTGPPA